MMRSKYVTKAVNNMKKLKVKVSDFDPNDPVLLKIKAQRIAQARSIYAARPFLTKLYISINYKFPLEFLKANWEEITKGL